MWCDNNRAIQCMLSHITHHARKAYSNSFAGDFMIIAVMTDEDDGGYMLFYNTPTANCNWNSNERQSQQQQQTTLSPYIASPSASTITHHTEQQTEWKRERLEEQEKQNAAQIVCIWITGAHQMNKNTNTLIIICCVEMVVMFVSFHIWFHLYSLSLSLSSFPLCSPLHRLFTAYYYCARKCSADRRKRKWSLLFHTRNGICAGVIWCSSDQIATRSWNDWQMPLRFTSAIVALYFPFAIVTLPPPLTSGLWRWWVMGVWDIAVESAEWANGKIEKLKGRCQ